MTNVDHIQVVGIGGVVGGEGELVQLHNHRQRESNQAKGKGPSTDLMTDRMKTKRSTDLVWTKVRAWQPRPQGLAVQCPHIVGNLGQLTC